MFKWYKDKKKKKIEKNLKKCIEYDRYVIKLYQNYPNKIEPHNPEFKNEPAIAMGYCESAWDEFKKYDVDRTLWKNHRKMNDMAIKEYEKLSKKKKEAKLEKEKREKIDYYKAAILELQKEGRI